MEPMLWGIIGAVAMAFINSLREVAILWIKAAYHVETRVNGKTTIPAGPTLPAPGWAPGDSAFLKTAPPAPPASGASP